MKWQVKEFSVSWEAMNDKWVNHWRMMWHVSQLRRSDLGKNISIKNDELQLTISKCTSVKSVHESNSRAVVSLSAKECQTSSVKNHVLTSADEFLIIPCNIFKVSRDMHRFYADIIHHCFPKENMESKVCQCILHIWVTDGWWRWRLT